MKEHKRHPFHKIYPLIFLGSVFMLAFSPQHPAVSKFSEAKVITVSQDGKGDFKSIQEAIDHLPAEATRQRIILIKKGIYQEKIFIEKNLVTLKGEDTKNTIITLSQAREVWRCNNPDDWGTATINLKGNDITLENLTVVNSYGFDATGELTIACPTDTSKKEKIVKKDSHQMALRSFNTTRLIAKNCIFRAGGGDTVSPWNKENGMFYFKNCTMEGGVDFYCPRGWAYAENCLFICHSTTAAIWHDGSKYKESKTVLNNCRFQGDQGFKLGRHHLDAQFYLLNCEFSESMADVPIYSAAPKGKTLSWGERIYYYNCHKQGGDYEWHKDNLSTSPIITDHSKINIKWTFDGKWDPAI